MFPAGLGIVLVTTVLCFSSLYVPQPILPVLGREFGVDQADAALLVAATLIPMTVAPILYGYFLQAVPAKRLLVTSLLVMALSQFAFTLGSSFEVALASRILLGVALPAAITALVTLCSANSSADRVRQVINIYIAATIVGGFTGRVVGGIATTLYDWRTPFLIVGCLLLLNFLLVLKMRIQTRAEFVRPSVALLSATLRTPVYLFSYLTIFVVFVVFAGILNLLSFRLEAIEPGISSARVSYVYAGYLVGILAALGASRLIDVLGDEKKALQLGLTALLVSVLLFSLPSYYALLANVFLLSLGMFSVHSLLTALVNHRASVDKPVVNGLYIAIYYAGGSLGSWVPALFYDRYGWNALLMVLALVSLVGFWINAQIFKDRDSRLKR